jgi:two-component system, cell cycle sensor histidine kinase and response regulator CckA
LPVARESHSGDPQIGDENAGSTRGRETILLVEDDKRVRDLTASILRDCGYQVIPAANGADAGQVSHEFSNNIDLLITDVVLPSQSGPEVAAMISSNRPHMRVLYTSGYTDNPTIRQALMAGDSNFLQKPFSPTQLALKVRNVLDGHLVANSGL